MRELRSRVATTPAMKPRLTSRQRRGRAARRPRTTICAVARRVERRASSRQRRTGKHGEAEDHQCRRVVSSATNSAQRIGVDTSTRLLRTHSEPACRASCRASRRDACTDVGTRVSSAARRRWAATRTRSRTCRRSRGRPTRRSAMRPCSAPASARRRSARPRRSIARPPRRADTAPARIGELNRGELDLGLFREPQRRGSSAPSRVSRCAAGVLRTRRA